MTGDRLALIGGVEVMVLGASLHPVSWVRLPADITLTDDDSAVIMFSVVDMFPGDTVDTWTVEV